MANRTPSSFEKTKLASSLEGIYPKKFNFKEELHSSPEVIKAHLMNHIAAINPKLAQQIIQSPTEAHVLEIISKVEVIASTKAANDERFALAA